MSNKKDRWSALSLKDRADLIKLYVSNGITSLDTIKKEYNSFGDGGNTDSKREMAEIDADYFLRGWYNNPTTQAMMDQLDTRDYSKYPVVTPNDKEITDPHLARRVRVSSALNTPVNYVEFPENKGGEFVFRNSNPKDNDININQDLWGNALMSALVHEGDHAVQYEMPFILQTTQPVKHELKAGYLPDKYLDNRKEIRSRIMSTREALNLDPNKRDYTPEEAAAIQQQLVDNKHLHRDNAQLDRLTPETMAGYLNYLADSDVETEATTIGGIRSAKHGGRILSGNENQNNEEVDKKLVEDVVRTTRGITGDFTTSNFPFIDWTQLGHAIDAWNVMKGTGKPAPPNDNYTGVAMLNKGYTTNNNLGFVSEEELINNLGEKPIDFVDAYVYGKTPFEKQGVYRKTSAPEKHIYRSKVAKVRNEGKEMPVFQTHRDTLDASLVKDLNNKLGKGLLDSLVYPNFTTEDSPFVLGDTGIYYDGNHGTVANVVLDDGRVVSKALDVFDTDPSEWNYKVGKKAKQGLQFIHDNTNPFIMTTPWYYPKDTRTEEQRLEALFGIKLNNDGDVIINKGDKNGKKWELWEALEWLDTHENMYNYVK